MKNERAFIVIEVYGGVASVTRVPSKGVEVVIVDHDNKSTFRNIDGQNRPTEGYKKNPRITK